LTTWPQALRSNGNRLEAKCRKLFLNSKSAEVGAVGLYQGTTSVVPIAYKGKRALATGLIDNRTAAGAKALISSHAIGTTEVVP
jgi:hypothetical protein